MYGHSGQLTLNRNPYSANCGYSGAQRSGGSASKLYTIDVPVYAGPDLPLDTTEQAKADAETLKKAWIEIAHRFSVTTGKETRTYKVLHNMANSVADDFKIYPPTDLKDDSGNTYFPYNTWGYAISGRNLKQYNSPMLLDSLVWNNYAVRGVGVEFTAVGGANQTGQFECCLIPNGVSLPPEPMTNMPNSFKVALANGGGKYCFDIAPGNTGQAFKDLRGIQERFDSNSDFGIIYFRCSSVGGYSQPTVIGNARILIRVELLNNNPNPFAQLIGAWVEAGYPISPDSAVNPDGGDGEQTDSGKRQGTTSTQMLSVSLNKTDMRQALRGKASMPRWCLAPTTKDKYVEPLASAHAAVAAHKKYTQRRRGQKRADGDKPVYHRFPYVFATEVDGFIHGNTHIAAQEAINAGDDDAGMSLYRVIKPAEPYVDEDTAFCPADQIELEVVDEGNHDHKFRFSYQGADMDESVALAKGGVKVDFQVNLQTGGLKAGATFCDITSFAIGADPDAFERGAIFQAAAGYNAGANCVDLSTDEEEEGEKKLFGIDWKKGLQKAMGVAGVLIGKESHKDGNLRNSKLGASMYGDNRFLGPHTSVHRHQARRRLADGTLGADTPVDLQAVGLRVPADATARAEVVDITDMDNPIANYTKEFFKNMPSLTRYSVIEAKPTELTEAVNRLTVTGQAINNTQTLMGLVGMLPDNFNPTYSLDVKQCMVLAASRVDPAKNPELFMKTAISLVPAAASWSTGHAEGAMYRNTKQGLGFRIENEVIHNGKIREENAPLSAYFYAPVSCDVVENFTVAWPKKLVDPDDYNATTGVYGLSPLREGETVYFSLIKGTARTISTTVPSSGMLGTYSFFVFPDLVRKEDLPLFKLELEDGMDVKAVLLDTEAGKLTSDVYFTADAERRFSVESFTPIPKGSGEAEDEVSAKDKKRRLMRTV